MGIAFIAENGKAGLFMQDFAAEWVDHAYGTIEHSTHNRLIQTATLDQFADEHTFIDQCDVKITGHEATIAIFYLTWVGDDTFQSLGFEILLKQHKLAVAGNFT